MLLFLRDWAAILATHVLAQLYTKVFQTLPADFVSDDLLALGGQQGIAPGSQFSAASHGSVQIPFGISFSDAQCVCLLPLPAHTNKQHVCFSSPRVEFLHM